VFSTCRMEVCEVGMKQSPIDVKMIDSRYQGYRPFSLRGHEKLSLRDKKIYLKNTGTTLKILPSQASGSQAFLTGGPLNTEYEFFNMHFHWGNTSSGPGSEHKINGNGYPLEVHFVHKSIHDATLQAAVSHQNGLAVLGFVFQIVPESTPVPGMDALINQTQLHVMNNGNKYDGTNMNGNDVNVASFLPVVMDEYFHYKGSLTTGECQEAVNWIVFSNPLAVHERHLRVLRDMQGNNGHKILNNFRGIQPLNGRPLYYHGVKHIQQTSTPNDKINRNMKDYVLFNGICPLITQPEPAVMATASDRSQANTLWNNRQCSNNYTSTSTSNANSFAQPSQVVCWLGFVLMMFK